MRTVLVVVFVAACASSAPSPPKAPPAPAPTPARGWFCWVDEKTSRGRSGCERTLAGCRAAQDPVRAARNDPEDYSPCAPFDHIYCFTTTDARGAQVDSCYANPGECHHVQEYLAEQPDPAPGDPPRDTVTGCVETP